MRLIRKRSLHAIACIVYARGARYSWSDCVVKDLQWIASRSHTLASLKDASMGAWVEFLEFKAAAGTLVKAFSEPLLREREAWEIRPFPSGGTDLASGDYADSPLCCTECSYSAKTVQQLAVHLAVKHGIKREFRKYVDTTWCTVCLLHFGPRVRVVDHLQRNPVCRLNVQCSLPILANDVVMELDEEDRVNIAEGKRYGRKHGIICGKACRMLGPYLPVFGRTEGTGHAHPLGGSGRQLFLRPEEFAA